MPHKIESIIAYPNGKFDKREGTIPFEEIQTIVDGFLEIVPPTNYSGKRIRRVWVDEEGLLKHLPSNFLATELIESSQLLVGIVVIELTERREHRDN